MKCQLPIRILTLFFILCGLLSSGQPQGESLLFNGSNDYAEVNDNASLDFVHNVTVEAWVFPCKIDDHNMIISKNWCQYDQLSYYFSIKDGMLQWRGSISGLCSGGFNVRSVEALVPANKWSHVAVVHDADSIYFYFNGNLVENYYTSGSYSPLYLGDEPLIIGAYKLLSGQMGHYYSGRMDEVRIWNRALTREEIRSSMGGSLVGNELNLVLYLNMDDISGSGSNVILENRAISTGSINNALTKGSANTPFSLSNEIDLGNLNLGDEKVLCNGEMITLSAVGSGLQFLWQDGSVDPEYDVIEPGKYWVDVYIGDCFASDTVNVVSENLSLGNDTLLCRGDNMVLEVDFPGADVLWSNGAVGEEMIVNNAGEYWVHLQTENCLLSDTIMIDYYEEPIIFTEEEIIMEGGSEFELKAPTGFEQYLWQDGSTGRFYQVKENGVYWVEVFDGLCTWTDTVKIVYGDCNSTLFVPNCFTPNNDQLNDEFHIVETNISFHSLLVFNRWGQLVFETYDIEKGWDGKYNGNECPSGTYFYKVDYTESCGDREVKKLKLGAVMLLR